MRHRNYLLFSQAFLNRLDLRDAPQALGLIKDSARDWYPGRKTESVQLLVKSWIRPMFLLQDLQMSPAGSTDPNAYTLADPESPETPIGVCYIAPYDEPLDGLSDGKCILKGKHWMARAVSAAKQMAAASGNKSGPWAILTNGRQWRLILASHLRAYEAFLEIDLDGLIRQLDDPMAAVLFRKLFSREAFRRDTTGKCLLDHWLADSEAATAMVEEHLRDSISDNLDVPGDADGIMAQICMGLVKATGKASFSEDGRAGIYRDATYLLYRLLFVLYAEARELLPVQSPAYQPFSLRTILEVVRHKRQFGPADGLATTEVWDRLERLFKAIHDSDELLGIPKYNGGLFDDEDKPYLRDCKIADAFMARALWGLAILPSNNSTNSPEMEIDYRDLSVRHLGSLYEGMIEYKLFIADEPLIARRDKNDQVKYLPASSTRKGPNDELINLGAVYFAQNPTERKATGTHYTSEDLVETVVTQTVLRLLESRWAIFWRDLEPWLVEGDRAHELTRMKLLARADQMIQGFVWDQVMTLRICDPAMGSGHFLVHTAHRVTDFILEKLSLVNRDDPGIDLTPDFWRRKVVESSLFGADVSEMAVELAKLSLWLATMNLGKPLSFLDHRLIQGNSLIGTTLATILDALTEDSLTLPVKRATTLKGNHQLTLAEAPRIVERIDLARQMLTEINNKVVETALDVKSQETDYVRVKEVLRPYTLIGNLIVARNFGWQIKDDQFHKIIHEIVDGKESEASIRSLIVEGIGFLGDVSPIHWDLTFPDVFEDSEKAFSKRFDILLGNPPYLGGSKISKELGDGFLQYLKHCYSPSDGQADLCAYFLRRVYWLLKRGNGFAGFITTNTIAQGDTRRTGLGILLGNGYQVVYADRYIPWKGDATVEVNIIVISNKDASPGKYLLDGLSVPEISSYLDDLPEKNPNKLAQNQRKSYRGDDPMGKGFFLGKEETKTLIAKTNKNSDCLLPFLVGEDVNNTTNQQASRNIICFYDWPLEKATLYPDLLEIVKTRVKPYRDGVNRERRRIKWWLFGEYGRGMRKSIENLERVLVRSRVSEHHVLAFVPKRNIFDSSLVIFAFDQWYEFGILQSGIHEVWLRRQASTMRTDIRYTPTDCFQTFPFPQWLALDAKDKVGGAASSFFDQRHCVLENRRIGLTDLYNLFHNPSCKDQDILTLRDLMAKMNQDVLAGYRWEDISPTYGFYPNPRKKMRFGMDPASQREIFIRLLELNQQIANNEATQGILPQDEDEPDQDEA